MNWAERGEAMNEDRGPVLVTGFGPFRHHPVNASWAAVQELEAIGISQPTQLVTKEIPVAYHDVSKNIPELLKAVMPCLCLHVGVSPYNKVVMEKRGSNHPYLMSDIHGGLPHAGKCVSDGPDYIDTTFDLDKVLEKVSERQTDVQFKQSDDAGGYLCDFIYYTSLHAQCAPVLFVHVPELGKPYTVHQLAGALKNIIEVLLDEIRENC